MNLRQFLNGWSSSLVNLVANVAPWIAPLPTAWLVYYRTMVHLHWPQWVAISAGVTLELLGVAILATALDLYDYNGNKRKSDPRAPFWLALVLVVLYFITALLLTVVLDVSPTMARLAPALFPVLSVASFALLALRSDHGRRLNEIATGKAEAKQKREQRQREREQAERLAEQLPNESEQAGLFTCPICSRSFDSQAALSGHGNKHRNDKVPLDKDSEV